MCPQHDPDVSWFAERGIRNVGGPMPICGDLSGAETVGGSSRHSNQSTLILFSRPAEVLPATAHFPPLKEIPSVIMDSLPACGDRPEIHLVCGVTVIRFSRVCAGSVGAPGGGG